MSSQTWRTFLSDNISVPEKGDTKAASHRQECLEMLLPNSDMYPEVEKQRGSMGPLVWQGKDYPSGALPSDNVLWEILWELYEVNFIHELQSLDRRACADLDVLSPAQLSDRQAQISLCFPTSSFRHVSIPSENLGLAADDFNNCFWFVTGLVLVMKSWKGEKPAILTNNLSDLT